MNEPEKIVLEKFKRLTPEQQKKAARLISDDLGAAFWWLRKNGFAYNHALHFDEAARFIGFVKELEQQ